MLHVRKVIKGNYVPNAQIKAAVPIGKQAILNAFYV